MLDFSGDINGFVDFRLVGGAGDIKLTKDGNTLLREMVSIVDQFD